jgi:hypothetical protein
VKSIINLLVGKYIVLEKDIVDYLASYIVESLNIEAVISTYRIRIKCL